jgi:putative tricarboxylic transport membrane protein
MPTRFRVRDPQGLTLGVLFIVLAVLVIVLSNGYRPGTAVNMGPGYFPRLLGIGLLVIGVAVSVLACRVEGERVDWRPTLRPTGVLLAAILLFALTVQPLGAFVAVTLLMVTSALASPESRPVETLVSAVVVSGACGLIFIKGLGMQVPLWPWFWQ